MGDTDFEFEFFSKLPAVRDETRDEVKERLRALTKGHRDMTGASVTIQENGHQTDEPYEARVVAYTSPKDATAVERGTTPEQALKRAINVVERQVREGREKRAAKGGRITGD